MTKITPFKATIYNQEKIKDLSHVVCPPYDIISPAKQEYYHELHPYNLIHILLGRDIAGKDKYVQAEEFFKDWLKNKVLVQDESPAVYFYSHQYYIKGEKRTRLGFIALISLGDANSSVYAHEHTRMEAKEDRLRLLRQVKANLSPIFVIFPDKKKVIPYLNQKFAKEKKPFMEVVDDDKNVHKIWKVHEPEILDLIQAKMVDEKIFIADGHHRFEVSCVYREEMKKKLGSVKGTEGFNYVMAYFTNVDPLGLTILPIHRLVKLDKELNIERFLTALKENFYVEEIKDKTRFFFLLEKAGRSEHILGMYHFKKYLLIRLRNIKILDKLIQDKPVEYRRLDVSILNYLILKDVLKLDLDDKDSITLNPHSEELIECVDSDSKFVAFFLNPTKMEQIVSVALTGNKMPPKSTYFYPKVLSGLVINKHEEG